MAGLRKTNAELLLAKGIEQKVPDTIIPDESLVRAENVDFSKVGIAKKRKGFVPNSNMVLNGGALDEVRRLGVRQRREVLCITETVTQLGSTAGAGYAGDTLFSYSEEAERWVPKGKMPRPNVDVLWTSGVPAAGNIGSNQQYVTGGIGNYVCVAYQAEQYSRVRVIVFDVGGDVNGSLREAPAVIIDTVFTATGTYLAGWAQAGDNVWLVMGSDPNTVGPAMCEALAFRLGTLSFDVIPTPIRTEQPAHAVSTDGTDIYVACRYGTGGYELIQFDSGMAEVTADFQNGTVLTSQEIAIDARAGYVDVARHDRFNDRIYVSRHNKFALSPLVLDVFVINNVGFDSAAGNLRSNLCIATTSETDAVILWGIQSAENLFELPTFMSVITVQMSSGGFLGYFDHLGLVPYAQPFSVDGRWYFVAMHTSGLIHPNANPLDISGTITGEESFMCFQLPLENINPYNVPFPSAQWDFGNCVCKLSLFGSAINGTYWMEGKTVYQNGSGVYVLTNAASIAGQSTLDFKPVPRLTRLEFGDAAHRWRHEEFHDVAAFAGGMPFVYDGSKTYELSNSLHQPAFIGYSLELGGTLPVDEPIFLRFVMLYVDGNGRECWGQPSRIKTITPTNPLRLTVRATVMPVTTTMKPDLGNGSIGRMLLYCFAATQSAPNEYRVAAPPQAVQPALIGIHAFSISAPVPGENSQMYTNGLELDNYPAPPCRAIAVHSGRLFAIASDSNEVYYTKPFNRERGAEFALGQTIPLPDKGTALASINDRLAVFTHRSILAIGGDGPDVTGSPPDAFSRPVLVSPDYGCVEYCAVGRTPLGIIFRGQQGFYLLGMGFDVSYIGGSVEDITSRWQHTRSIVHDQKSACCRITGFTGERSEELCLWYDTKRWSLNVLADDVIDSIALGDNLLVGVDDLSVAVASRYKLGERTGDVFLDYGEAYSQVIETGWLSFQQAGVFKRIWRVYTLVRAKSDATVRVQVWKDWEERVSSDREFELIASATDPQNLRVHLKHQKLKAVKVRITVTSDGEGVELMKLGFELGMRQGGPKEVREQTQ